MEWVRRLHSYNAYVLKILKMKSKLEKTMFGNFYLNVQILKFDVNIYKIILWEYKLKFLLSNVKIKMDNFSYF